MTRALARSSIAFLLAAGLSAGAAAQAPPADPEIETRRLRQENARLQALAELAKGDGFYLVLEASKSELRLLYKGALLKTWQVSAIEIGSPRTLFVPREVPEDWRGRTWEGGRLDPLRELERIEIEVPESPDHVQQIEPLDAEKAIPAPPRFFVRYDGGLAVELVGGDGEPSAGLFARIGRAWSDAVAAVAGPPALRIRLVLAHADAAAIYRSLPEPSRFIVL